VLGELSQAVVMSSDRVDMNCAQYFSFGRK
jgi:hypothetical protein